MPFECIDIKQESNQKSPYLVRQRHWRTTTYFPEAA